MTTSQTFDALQKLLVKVPDGDKLSKLLEPANLLLLLLAHGYDGGEIEKRLKSGTIPGELLLELLEKEPDPDRLLEELGNTQAKLSSQPSVKPQPPAPKGDLKGFGKLFGKYHLIVVLVIISLTVIFPGLAVSGFLSNVDITRDTAILTALVGGAIAGAISNPYQYISWRSAIMGMVYGISTQGVTIIYTQGRTSIFGIEFLIPLLLGAIPAIGVAYLLAKVFPSSDQASQQTLGYTEGLDHSERTN